MNIIIKDLKNDDNKAICEKCGYVMQNVKKGHADLCYKCAEVQK